MNKVAIVHYTSPPVFGGVERVINDHIDSLIAQGVQVKVISGKGDAYRPELELILIPEIFSLEHGNLEILQELRSGTVTARFDQVKQHIEKRLKDALADCSHCIIHNVLSMHFCMPLNMALWSLIDNHFNNIKFINYIHDNVLKEKEIQDIVSKFPTSIKKSLSRYEPSITNITISNSRAAEIAPIYGVTAHDFSIIPNGINLINFLDIDPSIVDLFVNKQLFDHDLVFLFPARVDGRKSMLRAIQLIKPIKDFGKRAAILITGPADPHSLTLSSEYMKRIDKLVAELEVDDSVHLLYNSTLLNQGSKNYKLIRDLYLLSDALIFTTKAEGFGIPMLEAGFLNKPIVCTGLPVLREIADNNAFFLPIEETDPVDVQALCEFVCGNPFYKMRKKILQHYIMQAVVKNDLLPLLID